MNRLTWIGSLEMFPMEILIAHKLYIITLNKSFTQYNTIILHDIVLIYLISRDNDFGANETDTETAAYHIDNLDHYVGKYPFQSISISIFLFTKGAHNSQGLSLTGHFSDCNCSNFPLYNIKFLCFSFSYCFLWQWHHSGWLKCRADCIETGWESRAEIQ